MEEWKECRLKDIVEINPTESLKKGTVAKKIGMDVLQPYCRAIPSFSFEPYTGGTKFKNGDTIMARITPCLENGKTAMVNILDDNEIGFGSTEYIVFRAKNNITDPYFIYYLVTSDCIRNPAIKSMVGSSGHQRVQTDVVANLSINLPPLPTQQKIAAILSSLDDKIELNNKINTSLEQQVQALFKNWFVDFEPFGGKMPEWWKLGKLSDIAEIKTDIFKPEQNPDIQVEHYSLPAFDEKRYPTFEISKELKSNKFIISNDEVLVSKLNPTVKRVWRPYCLTEKSICSTEFIVYKPISAELKDYLFSIVNSSEFNDFMCSNVTGSTNSHQRTPPKTTLNYEIPIPPKEILHKFCDIVTSMYDKIKENIKQNETVSSLRDTLLPKLMNEKIEI